ncbi:MAG TPA: hypothetical protein VGE40_04475 [Bacilli bacterium]
MNTAVGQHSNKARLVSYLAMMILAVIAAVLLGQGAAHAVTSGDAYITYDSPTGTWTMGTALGEQKVQFSSGKFLLKSFKNKSSGREYLESGMISEEFSITVNSTVYTGNSGGYTYDSHTITTLPAPAASPSAPGALLLAVVFHNSLFQITAYYEVYPTASATSYTSQSLIRRWVSYKNTSGSSQTITDPFMLNFRVMASRAANLQLAKFQGGGHERNYSPEWVNLSSTYYEEVNSDTSHITPGLGHAENLTNGSSYASPFYVLKDTTYGEGIYAGFDYLGLWKAELGNKSPGAVYIGTKLKNFSQSLANNAILDLPKSFTGVYVGDLDNVTEQLYDWQYVYRWDYSIADTNDSNYYNFTIGGNHEEQIFKTVNIAREAGGNAVHEDAGWYDLIGNWIESSADYRYVMKYAKKSLANLMIWMPLHQYQDNTTPINENPSWATDPVSNPWNGYMHTFDLGNDAVTARMKDYALEKKKLWNSSYMYRTDGSPMEPTSTNTFLKQYNNYIKFFKDLKVADPTMMVNSCSGGGEFLDWDMLEVSDTTQLTDTNIESFYYATTLYPMIKYFGINGGGDSNTMTQADIDSERARVNNNNYFKTLGIKVRYEKIYHPTVTGALNAYDYLQRMKKDRTVGIIEQWNSNIPAGAVTIYPKALNPTLNYTVTFLKNTSIAAVTQTGTYWMTNGITIPTPQAGEVVLLNVPNMPGRGTDVTAPSIPTNVTKKLAGYLGHAGVELNWTASTDNNWFGYYEIFRAGVSIGKVSKGTFYLDSFGHDINAAYTIKAADPDNNKSAAATATYVSVGNNAGQAALGFSGTQGTNNWSYMEWNGTAYVNMTYDSPNTRWNGTSANANIGNDWMHPGVSTDSARVYTAQLSGRLVIESKVHRNTNLNDGDNIKVMKNGTQIWPASGWTLITDTTDIAFNLIVEVNVGDKIYFVVNRNGDAINDYLYWNPTVSYDRLYYKASVGFSTTQGANNWRYQQWNGSTYSDMTWDAVNSWWVGSYAFSLVGNNWQHPDTNDSVRVFVAPQSGTIIISGFPTKPNTGSDGVNIKIMKSSTQIWPASGWRLINVTSPVQSVVTTTVTKNTKIYFIVNKNSTPTNDYSSWDPIITYQ